MSVRMSVRISVRMPVRMPAHMSVHMCIRMSVRMSVRQVAANMPAIVHYDMTARVQTVAAAERFFLTSRSMPTASAEQPVSILKAG